MVHVGVSLPVVRLRAGADIPALARHAEDVGMDAVWAGDHLATGAPLLDSTVALSAAAASTERVRLGYGVMLLAMRPLAWAAKQIASLQYLSHNRVTLGVGVGGEWPDEWQAAGAPLAGRGRRTDEALDLLPDLLGGKETRLPGDATITLDPAVPMPPVWIGGVSDRALRRAVRHGRGWLASMVTPEQLRASAARLAELAGEAGRASPAVGSNVFVSLGEDHSEQLAGYLAHTYGLDPEHAARLVVGGSPAKVGDRLAEYVEAGAEGLVVVPFGPDTRRQYELAAEARAQLPA